MTLLQFLEVMRRRWLPVLLLTLLGVAAAAGVSQLQTPTYRSSAGVFVSVNGNGNVSDLSQGNNFSAARVKSYAALAVTPEVLGAAAAKVGLDPAAADLRKHISVEVGEDTVIITVSATTDSPDESAKLANAVTDALVAAVDKVEDNDGPSLVHLSVVQRATPASAPVAPRIPVNLAIGLLGGLTLGLASALLREVIDTRLRSVEVLHRTIETNVLGEFPFDDGVRTQPLLDTTNRYTPRAEAFRQLRTQLTFTNLDGAPQSLVITSACPGEGKSSTAVNLALSLAQAGASVLLVDADLRRPKVGDYLGLESRVGLTTVLARQVTLDDAIQLAGDRAHPMHVLTAGRVPPNPSELLGSQQMTELVRELERRYEYVIVDAPPALPVTDPAILGAICSGVVLVVSMNGSVRRADVQAAHSRFERIGARVLGVALNKMPVQRKERTYYDYEASAPVSESPRRVGRARNAKAARSRSTKRSNRRSGTTTPKEQQR